MTVSVEARSNYFRSLTNLIAFHFRMKISHLLLIFFRNEAAFKHLRAPHKEFVN